MLYAPSFAEEAEREARAMFRRVLTGWAMDLLSLRRAGLDRPSAREGSGRAPMTPGAGRARMAPMAGEGWARRGDRWAGRAGR